MEGKIMRTVSKVLLAATLAAGLAGPVLAQTSPDNMTFEERNVYLFTPDGRMVRMKAGNEAHAMMMKNMKPMKTGTIIYRSGNKLYWATDTKMASGKMMHEAIFMRNYPY